jgi:hypothetical protein
MFDVSGTMVMVAWLYTGLTTTGIYLVLQDGRRLLISIAVVATISVWLRLFWYDKLEDYPGGFSYAQLPIDQSS